MSLNVEYLDNMIAQLDSIENATCEHILLVMETLAEAMENLLSAIISEIAKLSPFAALLDIPFPDPVSIVKWIKKQVFATIGPQVEAMVKLVTTVAQVAVRVARLMAKITEIIPRIANCFTFDPSIFIQNILDRVGSTVGTGFSKLGEYVDQIKSLDPTYFLDIGFDTSSPENFLLTVDQNAITLNERVKSWAEL